LMVVLLTANRLRQKDPGLKPLTICND
jgi:hypothetical protein